MTAFDYVVLAILGLSIVLSVWRGAVREVLALVSWVVAFVGAQAYGPTFATYWPATFENPSLRLFAGFIAVFILGFILTSLVAIAISRLVRAAGLGILDRLLGAMFGLLRGMLIVLTLVLLAGLTSAPRYPVWHDAMLSPPLEAAASVAKSFLPAEFARRISYD